MEYDFRSRFTLPLSVVGDSMTYGEALRLIKILRADTESQITTAMEGWDFPANRTQMAILDLFDVTVMANSDSKKGRPKPHPGRPMSVDTTTRRKMGNVGNRTPDQVRAILAQYARGVAV